MDWRRSTLTIYFNNIAFQGAMMMRDWKSWWEIALKFSTFYGQESQGEGYKKSDCFRCFSRARGSVEGVKKYAWRRNCGRDGVRSKNKRGIVWPKNRIWSRKAGIIRQEWRQKGRRRVDDSKFKTEAKTRQKGDRSCKSNGGDARKNIIELTRLRFSYFYKFESNDKLRKILRVGFTIVRRRWPLYFGHVERTYGAREYVYWVSQIKVDSYSWV